MDFSKTVNHAPSQKIFFKVTAEWQWEKIKVQAPILIKLRLF